jgi:adenylate cyclase
LERKLAAILVADVVGYSRLMGEDEAGTLERLKSLRKELVQPMITKRKGRIIKLMGDGLLAEFPSVVEAVRCAHAIQEGVAERESGLTEGHRIRLRIGVNLGDIIVEGSDIYGDGVNVAARLEGLADPGGVCISGAAFDAVEGKLDLPFEDIGAQQVKNVAKPVRAYRLAVGHRHVAPKIALGAPPPLPNKPSIAVLPFANMSGDPEQEFFSDGISEDIITDLSRVSGLFVVAGNSVFAYKGKAVKVQRICEDLGVRYVLEGSVRKGSVRKAGNRVRITGQLVDGTTGGHVWANRYDRDLTDIFEVQSDIAQNIVEALKVAIAPKEQRSIQKTPTDNLEAYEFYLRGRQFLHEMTRKNLERARKMFSKAIELDPDYVEAHAGLADCGSVLYLFYASDPDILNDALTVSRRALELAPGLAEAHVSHGLALFLDGDDGGARREFETAIRLDPTLYEAYWYFGVTCADRGLFEQAADLFEQASQIRGDNPQSMMMLMVSYQGSGRHADNRAIAERTMPMVERRLELNPEDSRAAYVGAMALVYLGDRPRALEWADLAAVIDSQDSRTNYNLACLYSLLGKFDKCISHLELSIKGGRPVRHLEWAKTDPDLENVRHQPRFQELLREWANGAAGH